MVSLVRPVTPPPPNLTRTWKIFALKPNAENIPAPRENFTLHSAPPPPPCPAPIGEYFENKLGYLRNAASTRHSTVAELTWNHACTRVRAIAVLLRAYAGTRSHSAERMPRQFFDERQRKRNPNRTSRRYNTFVSYVCMYPRVKNWTFKLIKKVTVATYYIKARFRKCRVTFFAIAARVDVTVFSRLLTPPPRYRQTTTRNWAKVYSLLGNWRTWCTCTRSRAASTFIAKCVGREVCSASHFQTRTRTLLVVWCVLEFQVSAGFVVYQSKNGSSRRVRTTNWWWH